MASDIIERWKASP